MVLLVAAPGEETRAGDKNKLHVKTACHPSYPGLHDDPVPGVNNTRKSNCELTAVFWR